MLATNFARRATGSGTSFVRRMSVKTDSRVANSLSYAGMSALAGRLAQEAQPGDTFCLHGKMGVGKTAFAREFLRSLTEHPDLEVVSPTFTIDITYRHDGRAIHHIDLHRLPLAGRDGKDGVALTEHLSLLGLDRALREDICLVEWPDRLGALYPAESMDIIISDGEASMPLPLLRKLVPGAKSSQKVDDYGDESEDESEGQEKEQGLLSEQRTIKLNARGQRWVDILPTVMR
jgi:tRNA threonylcarbamoyladenosine biosynthesis protein TsaE